jgi:8-oxo-dGTP diphosphatase
MDERIPETSTNSAQEKEFGGRSVSTRIPMNQNTTKVINVVAGLIYRDGRLLVCQRRADREFPLKWEFPGGKVEEPEADIDALRRELREELTIEMGEAVLVYQHTHRYPEGPTVSLRFYFISAFDGDAQNVIFEKISWVKVADLAHIDFLEGDRPIIEKLLVGGDSLVLGK